MIQDRHKSTVASAAVLTLVLAASAVVLQASPAQAHGQAVDGNKNCKDLIPGSPELRVEDPASNTYTDGTLTVVLTVSNLTADDPAHPGNQTGSPVVKFTATGGSVIGAAVKGGPNTQFYDYRPGGVTSASGLHAPVNPNNGKFYGLSHVSFCYQPKAKTTITTKVSAPSITIGGTVSDTATLAGGTSPTGTIAFSAYGPNDLTCSGTPAFTSSVAVAGNGSYTSAVFTPSAVGTYRWIARYSGDAKNLPSAGACGDANEEVVVKKAQPKLGTKPNVLPNDTATIVGLVGPSGGSLTFSAYVNATCTGAPAYTQTVAVNANGTFVTTNTTFSVSSDATVSWVVEYSGDAKNERAKSGCSEEQVVLDFTPLA